MQSVLVVILSLWLQHVPLFFECLLSLITHMHTHALALPLLLPPPPQTPYLPLGLDATAKARHALSLLERLRSALASLSASTTALLQPTANSLAGALCLF